MEKSYKMQQSVFDNLTEPVVTSVPCFKQGMNIAFINQIKIIQNVESENRTVFHGTFIFDIKHYIGKIQ